MDRFRPSLMGWSPLPKAAHQWQLCPESKLSDETIGHSCGHAVHTRSSLCRQLLFNSVSVEMECKRSAWSTSVIENTVRQIHDGRYGRGFCDLLVSTNAMPPRIAAEAAARRGVIASDRNTTPPNAAISGTDNCTVAARMADSPFSAAYQMTYPMPDVSAPEAIARATPAASDCALLASTRLSTRASGAARTKLPAVAASGSATPRPRNEYTRHAGHRHHCSPEGLRRRDARRHQIHEPRDGQCKTEPCDGSEHLARAQTHA